MIAATTTPSLAPGARSPLQTEIHTYKPAVETATDRGPTIDETRPKPSGGEREHEFNQSKPIQFKSLNTLHVHAEAF
jgi:hypothetical protein